MEAKTLIENGLYHTIGTGVDTSVWSDNWIHVISARPSRDNGCYRDPDLKVHHLIKPETMEWNLELLHAFIEEEDIPRILSIHPSKRHRTDSVCWNYTKSGEYSVRSGYEVAKNLSKELKDQEMTEPMLTA